MKIRLSSLLPLFALLHATAAWNHITEARVRQAIRNDYTLVAFVEPSEDASKALEPEWISIQESERDNNVVSVDCSAKPKLCDEFGVVSFPVIRLFHGDGRVDRYRGPRRAAAIVGFLRRSLRPTISTLDDKNYTSFVYIDDVIFIARIVDGDSGVMERFQSLAEHYHDRYSFATAPAEGQKSSIGCFNNIDNEPHASTELTTVEALEVLVKECATPLVVELTRRNELEYMKSGRSLVHYFVKNDAERRAYLKEATPLAKKYREYLVFTTIDANEYADMQASLGLQPGTSKVLSLQNPTNGDVFPYTGKEPLTEAVMEQFFGNIIQGNIKPWVGPGLDSGRSDSADVKHEEL